MLDARFRPGDSLLLHLDEFELENVVSFLGAAAAGLRVGFAASLGENVSKLLSATGARGAIASRSRIRAYYDAIRELEGTPYGENYNFLDFPHLKMLIHTGRDPVPGFYTYESTYVKDPLPSPVVAIGKQLKADSELAFSFADAGLASRVSFSHAAVVQAGVRLGEELGLNFQDRVLVAVPQNRLFGLSCGVIPCIAHAALFVLDGPAFDAQRQAELLLTSKASSLIASPTLLSQIVSASNFKPSELVTKLALVVDQSSATEKGALAGALGQAKISFPKLATTLVASVDDRVAAGPVASKRQ